MSGRETSKPSRKQLKGIQEAYLDYNQHRIHSALGYLTPYEYLGKLKVTKNDL